MKATNETALVKACLSLLDLAGVAAWRQNTGAAKIGKRFVRFGSPGVADILGILAPAGRLLACEVKIRPNKPTADQEAFLACVNAKGGVGVVVYSLDDLRAVLSGLGLLGGDCA